MDPSTSYIAMINDEIMNTCDATLEANKNGHNSCNEMDERLYDDKFEFDVKGVVHQQDIDSNCDVEIDLFDQFAALEQANERDIGSDEAAHQKEIDENRNDVSTISDSKLNTCPSDGGEHIKYDESGNNSMDSIRSKGFSTRIYENLRVVTNLPLMAVVDSFSQHELRCEFFHPKMLEDDLVPLFTQFGQVYKLVKHTVKNTIFVTFTNAKDAEQAITSLDRRIIQGHKVRVYKQLPNKRLIVRNIPKTATKQELFNKFSLITKELQSVSLYNDLSDENKNRGFCYLEYPEHYFAYTAKKTLETSSKQVFSTFISVEWPDRHFEWSESPDTLYITNLRKTVGPRDLKRIFSVYGRLIDLLMVANFAKVQFLNVEDATRAAKEVDKSLLGNQNVEISFVKLEARRKEPNIDPSCGDTLNIYNLSPTLSASDLRKMFSYYGNVLDVELNRKDNLATIRFQHPEQSKRALCVDKAQLGNNVHVSLKKRVMVMVGDQSDQKKMNNQPLDTLHVNNLRSNITIPDLRKCFTDYGEVIEIDKSNDSASIRFRNAENAKRAAYAIDKFKHCLGDRVKILFDGQSVAVEKGRMQKKPAEVRDTLYIYNIYADLTTHRLRQLFTVYGNVIDIDIDRSARCATVRFRNCDDSRRAAWDINRIHLGKTNLEILFFPKSAC